MRPQLETVLNYPTLSRSISSYATSPTSGTGSRSPDSGCADAYLFAGEIATPLRSDTSLGIASNAGLADVANAQIDLRTATAQPHSMLDAGFSAANADNRDADRLHDHIVELFNTSRKVRAEIGHVALTDATRHSQVMQSDGAQLDAARVHDNQMFCIDSATGKGLPYLHERDKPFAAMLEDGGRKVFTFLPGYATGDRYTLIIAALVEPRLNVIIGYAVGGASKEVEKQKRDATTAYDVLVNALEKNGVANARKRVTLCEFDGDARSLKQARESLDSPDTRERFGTPDAGAITGDISGDDHIFHISVTTELIRRQFARDDVCASQRHNEIRDRLWHLVDAPTRERIDKAVDHIVAHYQLDDRCVALWIADREGANERESQAISRPLMFEQMAQRFAQEGFKVFDVADTFINPSPSIPRGTFDRHPYRPEIRPQIGRFWNGTFDTEKLLAPRENQWYFMDRLLSKTGSRLAGIRSGALEPFALFGHTVVYLEHKDMFTPERHASWQGYIPYHRVITEKTTGYMSTDIKLDVNGQLTTSREAQTELTAARLKRTLVDHNMQSKQIMQREMRLDQDDRGAPDVDTLIRTHVGAMVAHQSPLSDANQPSWQRLARSMSVDMQDRLSAVETSIREGVLHPAELDLIATKLNLRNDVDASAADHV